MVAESHLIDRSRVEKVKRNLFGTPTEDEKKLFHSEYEKTINEERKVNYGFGTVRYPRTIKSVLLQSEIGKFPRKF